MHSNVVRIVVVVVVVILLAAISSIRIAVAARFDYIIILVAFVLSLFHFDEQVQLSQRNPFDRLARNTMIVCMDTITASVIMPQIGRCVCVCNEANTGNTERREDGPILCFAEIPENFHVEIIAFVATTNASSLHQNTEWQLQPMETYVMAPFALSHTHPNETRTV